MIQAPYERVLSGVRSPAFWYVWRRVGLSASLAVVSACASLPRGPLGGAVARLESATVRNAYDASPSSADVRIQRGGTVVRASAGTALNLGDTIVTSSVARVILQFAVGYEVVMDTGTTIFIEEPTDVTSGGDDDASYAPNSSHASYASRLPTIPRAYPLRRANANVQTNAHAPVPRLSVRIAHGETESKIVSIFLRLGQAFVRRLAGNSDTLNTRTPQALLQAHGTEYLVSVSRSATTIRVAEDAVDVTPRTGNFPRVTYTKFAGGVIADGSPARRMAPVTPAGLEQELVWVRQYDRITKISVPPLDSMTEAGARAALTRVGLKVLLVTHRTTGRAAAERVVDYSPGAEQKVAPGTFINLVLEKPSPSGDSKSTGAAGTSDGVRVAYCTVPRLIDQTAQTALRLLEGAHFKSQPSGDRRRGNFVSGQQEAAGSQMVCGSVIHYSLVMR